MVRVSAESAAAYCSRWNRNADLVAHAFPSNSSRDMARSIHASAVTLSLRAMATWAFMVPTMWAAMMTSDEINEFDLGSLRIVVSGGSPLQTHTKEAILKRFPHAGLNEFYGGTEVGLVTNLPPQDQARKVRSVGRPVIDSARQSVLLKPSVI